MEEIWGSIPGYEGLYEASTKGRIRSAEGKTTSSARFSKRVWKQRIIKPKTQVRKGSKGLIDQRVCLWKDGKEKTHLVSRLVAMTFCDVPYEKLTVNHKNGNPMDNRPENLEWVTLKENINHGVKNNLYPLKGVILIDNDLNEIEFKSMSEASRFLKKNVGYISMKVARSQCAYDSSGKKYSIRLKETI